MTGSIIERSARALAKAGTARDDWDTRDSQRQEATTHTIRAVLHAIREPSDAMVSAGAQVISAIDRVTGEVSAGDAARIWRFMVAAAMG